MWLLLDFLKIDLGYASDTSECPVLLTVINLAAYFNLYLGTLIAKKMVSVSKGRTVCYFLPGKWRKCVLLFPSKCKSLLLVLGLLMQYSVKSLLRERLNLFGICLALL